MRFSRGRQIFFCSVEHARAAADLFAEAEPPASAPAESRDFTPSPASTRDWTPGPTSTRDFTSPSSSTSQSSSGPQSSSAPQFSSTSQSSFTPSSSWTPPPASVRFSGPGPSLRAAPERASGTSSREAPAEFPFETPDLEPPPPTLRLLSNEAIRPEARPRRLEPFRRLTPAFLAAVAFVVGRTEGSESILPGVGLVALLLGSSLIQSRVAARLERDAESERIQLEKFLDVPARRVHGKIIEWTDASELRAGEEIWIGPGEIVPAEGTIVEGSGEFLLWPHAEETASRGVGDAVPSAALLAHGTIRLVCTVTARERPLTELIRHDEGRLDRNLPAPRLAQNIDVFGAPALAVITGVVTTLLDAKLSVTLAAVASVWGSLSGALLAELPRRIFALRLLDLARRGVVFPRSSSVDKAGQVTSVVLCARGTVLHGEPEVAEIETLHGDAQEDILALAAGAESVVHHPVARAVARSLAARGLVPDACRNHQPAAGMGVVCTSSGGRTLVVGNRELLLRERISIAVAEEKLRKLESTGQSALLVAADETLLGIIALVDGLRPGARAMVQRLTDAGLEPVLLSGDSRHTTEAVGRALAIDHLRPGVPAADRGAEVQKMAEGGAIVAVVGRGNVDESALYGSLVPISLGIAPTTIRERSIVITSENPLDAASCLVAAKEAQAQAWTSVLGCLVPGVFAFFAVTSLVAPPALGPVLAGGGALVTHFVTRRKRARSVARSGGVTSPSGHSRKPHPSAPH